MWWPPCHLAPRNHYTVTQQVGTTVLNCQRLKLQRSPSFFWKPHSSECRGTVWFLLLLLLLLLLLQAKQTLTLHPLVEGRCCYWTDLWVSDTGTWPAWTPPLHQNHHPVMNKCTCTSNKSKPKQHPLLNLVPCGGGGGGWYGTCSNSWLTLITVCINLSINSQSTSLSLQNKDHSIMPVHFCYLDLPRIESMTLKQWRRFFADPLFPHLSLCMRSRTQPLMRPSSSFTNSVMSIGSNLGDSFMGRNFTSLGTALSVRSLSDNADTIYTDTRTYMLKSMQLWTSIHLTELPPR